MLSIPIEIIIDVEDGEFVLEDLKAIFEKSGYSFTVIRQPNQLKHTAIKVFIKETKDNE